MSVTVTFTNPGTLGIEFVSLQPPYIVKKNSAPNLDVLPGDKLLSVLRKDQEFSVDRLTWTQLVGMLRDRPVTVHFERILQPSTLPLAHPASHPLPPPSPASPSQYFVTFASSGPLGLELERTQAPWVVDGVAGASEAQGVQDGDAMTAIDGEATDRMTWDEVRTRLTARPVTVAFRKGIHIPSVFALLTAPVAAITAASKAQNQPERPERPLRSISPEICIKDQSQIANLQEQVEGLMGELEFHKKETGRRRSIVAETQEEASTATAPYERILYEKQKEIAALNAKISELMGKASLMVDAEQRLNSMDERISQLLHEKKEISGQTAELNKVVEQLLKKLQVALDEKPNCIDKRIVIAAVKEYVNSEGNKHVASQRLADKLGLDQEERAAMQPKPSVSDAFISFLADNTD